jgi:solute carrier family 25 iron transporter 28/37
LGLFRGVTAVAIGAAPAHAIYFTGYEYFKKKFGGDKENPYQFVQTGSAGILATLMSDAVLVPMDAVKQKRQLSLIPYKGNIDCIQRVIKSEGVTALYAGYTTTLTMNVPYNFVYFATYETLRRFFKSDPEAYDPLAHVLAGGGAGVTAAALSNPLDVAKTRLQTQGDVGKMYHGMVDALKTIWREEGWAGYSRGVVPRMVFHSMSAGICWSVYEYMKYALGADKKKTATRSN